MCCFMHRAESEAVHGSNEVRKPTVAHHTNKISYIKKEK